jgi:hypothetical protein
MKRREILKYTAWATGAAVSAPLMSTLITGCKTEGGSASANDALSFFSDDEFDTLMQVIDTILPKTDSPSATEVGVHETIDHMVGNVYNDEDRAAYRKGSNALLSYLNEGGLFGKKSSAEKLEILNHLEDNSSSTSAEIKAAYMHLKQQAIAYYLTTEEIGTKFLNYLPVPGAYNGCISLAEAGGKAWAL